jgi:hypothetical protein
MGARDIPPEKAKAAIESGKWNGPGRVTGRLDLSNFQGTSLPSGLHCYDLDARGSRLTSLPDDLRIDSRLLLDGSRTLQSIPPGFEAGSISLRDCTSLRALPEGISTWFLDLTGCTAFETWPERGTVHHGALILRGCSGLRTLPRWLERLSQLDVAGCAQLSSLPEGLTVSGWVDLGGTGITGLPASLQGVSLRWRGVRIDERIAFHPDQLTAQEALKEPNAERRRVMIERIGYFRFSQESGAKVLDEDEDRGGPRQLLFINLREDEPLVGLLCRCPSTGRQYFLRVPPKTKTCQQGAAWIAGYDDPSLYRPNLET